MSSHPGRVNAIYARLADFVVRFRYAIVVFWVLVTAISMVALPSLSSQINSDNSAFLKSTTPSVKAANLAAPLNGSGAGFKNFNVQIVAAKSTPLNPTDLNAVQRVVKRLKGVSGVRTATLAGVSSDGKAAQVITRVKANQQDVSADQTLLNNITATFPKASGLQFHTAGQIATAVANNKDSKKQGNQTQMLSILLVIVLLAIVFRSPLAVLVTLLPSVVALLVSMQVIGELGAHTGVQISDITQILLIILMIGAGTDYGLFLVFRVRENLRGGLEPHDAVRKSVISVGESITGSAGTVILALLTLLVASFGLYHDLGLPLAIGVFIMLLIGLTLQPALLAIFGSKAFWPVKLHAGQQQEGLWGRVAKKLVAKPGLTLGIGVIVFLALAAGALGYKAGGFGGQTSAPSGSDAAAGNAALQAHFPRSSNNPANMIFKQPTSVWSNPTAISKAQTALMASGKFRQLAGPLDSISAKQLAQLYKQLGPPQRLPAAEPPNLKVPKALYNAYHLDSQYVSADGSVFQFMGGLTAGAQTSNSAMQATPQVRSAVSAAAKQAGSSDSGLGGQAAATYDINHDANDDLALIIPIAIIAIGLLLAAVLRSAVAPLYLIVSVALSYLASLGLATIIFLDIGNQGGITFVLPFLMFVFLLALGEDYNILVMTRIREEARHMPLKDAVVKAIARTGSTVTSAGIILGGTFAVFGVVGGGGGGGNSMAPIGFGLAAGILMDTFLVRTLLVPSIVILLGRWNWWPTKLGSQRASASVPPAYELQDPASAG